MKDHLRALRKASTVLCILCVAAPALYAQGPLPPPPGPPGQTMKTLDQIEPRTDIATLPGDGTYLHVISVPGSYFLSGNLTNAASGKGGIVVAANDVTVDFGGFSVTNTGASPVEGIRGAGKHLTLQHGSVRGWSKGVTCNLGGGSFDHLILSANGVGIETDLSILSDCVAEENTGRGFQVGSSTVTRCTARHNGNDGFALNDNAILTDCVASANTGSGFYMLAANCMLHRCSSTSNIAGFTFSLYGHSFIDCVAASNTFAGFNGGGADRARFTHCSAFSNQTVGFISNNSSSFKDCNASNNVGGGFAVKDTCRLVDCVAEGNGAGATGTGITAGIRVTVLRCTVNANRADGIAAGGDSVITDNHVSLNGAGGAAAGIHTTGGGSRIEGNQVRETTGTGILATTVDAIIRNSSGGNTTNYNPSSGTNFAPVQSPSTATNPLANLSF